MACNDIVSQKNDWDYFDRIYCITLAERIDRRRQAEFQFQKVGLDGRVSFVTVHRHPSNSEQGIYESHTSCLRQGLSHGARTILIFEDDVVFDRFSSKKLKACIAFLSQKADWKAFFFGCLVKSSHMTAFPDIVAIVYRCMAHAYVLKEDFARQLVNQPWQGVPFDAMLSRLQEDYYAVYPAFAFQSDSGTDNAQHRALDRFRRWFGGMQRIQKGNEWTRRHIKLIVVSHILGVAGIIGLAWLLIR